LIARVQEESKQKEKDICSAAEAEIRVLRDQAAKKEPEAIRLILSEFY
jgi:hypothetical protein